MVIMAIIYTTYLIGPAAILGCAIFFLFFPIQVPNCRIFHVAYIECHIYKIICTSVFVVSSPFGLTASFTSFHSTPFPYYISVHFLSHKT